MITGLAQTALLVKDYDAAIDFYRGKLGFVVIEDTRLEGKRWVRLKAPGGQGSDLLLSKAQDDEQLSFVGRQAGGRVLFYFHSNDFETDYEALRAAKVEFTESPRACSYGMVAVFKDLYGNRIDLIGPRKDEPDSYVENGLQIFTRSFHLRRGTCCESGCRNCPYGFVRTPNE